MNAPNRKSFRGVFGEICSRPLSMEDRFISYDRGLKKLDTEKHPSYAGIKEYVLTEWEKEQSYTIYSLIRRV